MKHHSVFDVNIWLSYFLNDNLADIQKMAWENDVSLYRSITMTLELLDVLNRPKFKKYFPDGYDHLLEFYLLITTEYLPASKFKDCKDEKDNYLFDLAYLANAQYLVSGDKTVLNTPVRETLKLLTLKEFKKEIGFE